MAYVAFEQLIAAIATGKHLASFPTDTVPALAAKPEAAALIYAAKQRQADKPLILMAADVTQLAAYLQGTAAEWEIWRSLMQTHWPGALTLVLPASAQVPSSVNPLHPGSVGVRIPDHALAQLILQQTGVLATTSANRSGAPALLEMTQIMAVFPQVYQLADDAWADLPLDQQKLRAAGQPSTVIKWMGGGWQLLRQGSVILPDRHLQPGPRPIQ
jgi:L-threonylcarbamoyladenylate synthase